MERCVALRHCRTDSLGEASILLLWPNTGSWMNFWQGCQMLLVRRHPTQYLVSSLMRRIAADRCDLLAFTDYGLFFISGALAANTSSSTPETTKSSSSVSTIISLLSALCRGSHSITHDLLRSQLPDAIEKALQGDERWLSIQIVKIYVQVQVMVSRESTRRFRTMYLDAFKWLFVYYMWIDSRAVLDFVFVTILHKNHSKKIKLDSVLNVRLIFKHDKFVSRSIVWTFRRFFHWSFIDHLITLNVKFVKGKTSSIWKICMPLFLYFTMRVRMYLGWFT